MRTEFGSGDIFQLPIALTTDQLSRFIICDQIKQRITVHKESGDLLQAVDIPEVATPQFLSFYANRLYICDGENKEIVVYKYYNTSTSKMSFVTKLITPGAAATNADLNPSEATIESPLEVPHSESQFLDCSAVCTDSYGSLFITDVRLNKIHTLNERGEMSCVIPVGRQIRRPTCITISPDGIMAVAQQGTDQMDHDTSPVNQIFVYKIMRADV